MSKSLDKIKAWIEINKIIKMSIKIGGFMPVISLIALVSWSYYAFVFRLCMHYLVNRNPTQAAIYLAIYHPLLILMSLSYLKATFKSPGYSTDIPSHEYQSIGYHQRSSSVESIISDAGLQTDQNVNSNDSIQLVSSRRSAVKFNENGEPVTSGSIMGASLSGLQEVCLENGSSLSMAFGTTSSFIYLFFWGTIYSFFLAFATLPPTIQYAQTSYEAIMSLDLNWTFLILLGTIFGLCLLGFTVYHTTLILSNQTTLESISRNNYKIKDGGEVTSSKYLNLFNVGKRANFIQVMGPDWFFWFLPIENSLGNGRTWSLNSHRYSTLCDSVEDFAGLSENSV
ncbi:10442_t:CDS:10 [Acaulospora morrowiae]|uniref:10442_t:CDS:1 n=1 Tax=Acaulospora morrowiae TaxID=94023 RepID=A0A9N8ZEZ4_9GLOM|nr:10442_t:CDS:10 [Acaulospora morrowiae]